MKWIWYIDGFEIKSATVCRVHNGLYTVRADDGRHRPAVAGGCVPLGYSGAEGFTFDIGVKGLDKWPIIN